MFILILVIGYKIDKTHRVISPKEEYENCIDRW